MKTKSIIITINPIDKNSKISMNNWKRHWKFRPSPMRNLFSASDKWSLHFWSTVLWLVKTLRRSIAIFEVKVLKAVFVKVKVHQSKFGSFIPVFVCPSACSKGFHYQKAIFHISLSTVPLTSLNWSNLTCRNVLP